MSSESNGPGLHPVVEPLLRAVRDAVILMEIDGKRIVLWNPAAEALWGYTAAEAASLSTDALVPERLRPYVQALSDEYHATGTNSMLAAEAPVELVILRKDGLERRVEFSACLVPIGGDEPRHALAIGRDVTERRQTEQLDLARARLDGVLLAARTAQHTLNNLLTLTVGYAEMVANDPRLPEDLRESAEEALQGAVQAVAIIERLVRIRQLEEVDLGVPGGGVIDLDRSATDETDARN